MIIRKTPWVRIALLGVGIGAVVGLVRIGRMQGRASGGEVQAGCGGAVEGDGEPVSEEPVAQENDRDGASGRGLPASENELVSTEHTYSIRMTNTTARDLKVTWHCGSNKLGTTKFPGGAGETKSFFVSGCVTPNVSFDAKILFDWEGARIYYDESGIIPPANTIDYISPTSTKGSVSAMLLGGTTANNYKMCFYAYESGIVKLFPRQCP